MGVRAEDFNSEHWHMMHNNMLVSLCDSEKVMPDEETSPRYREIDVAGCTTPDRQTASESPQADMLAFVIELVHAWFERQCHRFLVCLIPVSPGPGQYHQPQPGRTPPVVIVRPRLKTHVCL